MPLGILTEDEFQEELIRLEKKQVPVASQNGEVKHSEVKPLVRGRGSIPEVSDSARKLIGELAISHSAQEIQDEFNVSSSSISAYKHGSTSTASYNSPNPSLSHHINSVKEKITKQASKKIGLALTNMSEEKFSKADLRELSSVARDMSSVIKNLEPPVSLQSNDNRTQFVFFAPRIRQESEFDVIEVQE